MELKKYFAKHDNDFKGNFLTNYDVFYALVESIRAKAAFIDYLKSKRFDGITFNTFGSGLNDSLDSENHTIIVAFEPNQIKSITNKNPTNSNNINEDLESDYYRWQAGGEEFEKVFSQEAIDYMNANETTIKQSIYRCEYQDKNRKLKVGDIITFNRFTSFSKYKSGFYDVMYMWDDANQDQNKELICFKTAGNVKVFDIEKEFNLNYKNNDDEFGTSLDTQQEIFVKGKFKIIAKQKVYDEYEDMYHPLYIIEQL